MLKAKLMIIGGDAVQTEVQLKLPTTIGRGRESNLTVPHALVSRRHTEIIERDGRLFVRDLGSLNGTFVNNQRIVEETPLDPDQLLTLGNITFRAVYEIGDDGDTGRISTNDTEVIDIQQSDTERVASESDPSSSSLETIPVDSISQSPQDDGDLHRKETAYDNTNAPSEFAAGEATGSAGFESGQSYSGTMDHRESVSTEPVKAAQFDAAKLDSVKMELDGESDGDGQADSGLGSFLRRLPR